MSKHWNGDVYRDREASELGTLAEYLAQDATDDYSSIDGELFNDLQAGIPKVYGGDRWFIENLLRESLDDEPPAPSGCMVLIFALGLLAFEGLVRWLA